MGVWKASCSDGHWETISIVFLKQTFAPGPATNKLPAGRVSATTTKTNSHQDRKEPCATKNCVGQKLKFFKKRVVQAQAARPGGTCTFFVLFQRPPKRVQKSRQKSLAQ